MARTVYERDASGRVTLMTEDADGLVPRTTTYTWLNDTLMPISKTVAGLTESYTYDASQKVTSYSQTDALTGSPDFGATRTWTYAYQTLASGLEVLASVDGPGLLSDGVTDVTSYSYNTDGTIATITDPNGLVTTLESYNALGLPELVTEPNGFEWGISYDITGRVTSVTKHPNLGYPLTASFAYDVIGQMVSYTDFHGGTWTYDYDEARRLVDETNPAGETVAYEHDAMGNVTRTEISDGVNPATFWEDAEYDGLGRLVQTLGAQGQIWTMAHDVEDQLAGVSDPLGYSETYSNDPLKRLSEVVNRDGGSVLYSYDDADTPVNHTDPRSLVTDFVYNGFGEIISEVSPDRGTVTYAYNNRGLAISRTDGAGRMQGYEYDNGGRLTLVDNSANGGSDITYVYDLNAGNAVGNEGHLRSVSAGPTLTDFQLQSSSKGDYLAIRHNYLGNTWHNNYVWTRLDGQPVQMDYPNSIGRVIYTYDDSGRVIKVALYKKINGVKTTRTLVQNITYLPQGPIQSITYGDGSVQTRSYDASYRLTGISDALGTTDLRDVSMGYDDLDNLISVTDNLGLAGAEFFDYTPREMLQTASGDYGTLGFGYDAVGNRTYRSVDDGTTTETDNYSYATASNHLMSIALGAGGTRDFTYDAAGNVTYDNRSGQGYGYSYDGQGRLASFSINGVVQAEYQYNYLGQQAIRTLTQTGQTIDSVYDPITGFRIAEIDHATNTAVRGYVWLDGAPIAVLEGDDIYFVRSDHIGRPVLATDEASTTVWTASWLPFGGVHVENGVIDARFPGQWFQAESGLHQNWMRDYDPTTGRYIEADPLGLVDGPSVYNYALQSPGRYVDPRGTDAYVSLTPEAAWGAGHVGVSTDAGSGPNQTVGKYCGDSGLTCVAGADSEMRSDNMSKVTEIMRIPMSPANTRKVEACIQRKMSAPGTYRLVGASCMNAVSECLREGGYYYGGQWRPNAGFQNNKDRGRETFPPDRSKPKPSPR
tara:strand:+ start:373379 stop:376345 length:2967 start_codon:yes stop_codon:yes gene_type:complete